MAAGGVTAILLAGIALEQVHRILRNRIAVDVVVFHDAFMQRDKQAAKLRIPRAFPEALAAVASINTDGVNLEYLQRLLA